MSMDAHGSRFRRCQLRLVSRLSGAVVVGTALLGTGAGCLRAAEDHGVHAGSAYRSADDAIAAEDRILSLSSPAVRYRRLQELADWWFHDGGNYVDHNPYQDMIRVLRRMTEVDPTDVQTISDIFYYSVSVEVDELTRGRSRDFTLRPLLELKQHEAVNVDNLWFYLENLPVLQLVFRHPEFGGASIKRAYYRVHGAYLEKAEKLAANHTADASKIEIRLRVAHKVRARYRELAD